MIKLLIGEPGMGKTKEMIADANAEIATAKGSIIFVAESNESVLEVHHDIRFINISEFPIASSNSFIAFLHGLMVSNHDIESIYLDGISNVFIMTPDEICKWLDAIKKISNKLNTKFEISISVPGKTPECFKPYM
ncbi:MAG: hypothetical protein WBA54_07415 [Acidaminobacteraceae bacterium]